MPSSANQAQLVVYSADAKPLKTYLLDNGMNQVSINADTLSPGEYVYSLVIEGKRIDSKQMILTVK